MNGRCHSFIVIVFKALFEMFHLEKKCGIHNEICECAKDMESWHDSKNTRARCFVEKKEEGVFTLWAVAAWWVAAGLCHTQLCARDFVFPIEEDQETTKEK